MTMLIVFTMMFWIVCPINGLCAWLDYKQAVVSDTAHIILTVAEERSLTHTIHSTHSQLSAFRCALGIIYGNIKHPLLCMLYKMIAYLDSYGRITIALDVYEYFVN